MRTCVYIDGYNFYYSLKEEFKEKRLRQGLDNRIGLGWCDFRKLAHASALVENPADVTSLKYFTAKVTAEDPNHDRPFEPNRQANWLSAVQTTPGLRVIWGRHLQPNGANREEKQTDVNIAVELLFDSLDPDGCDHAILVTGDTDLAPAAWAFLNRAPEFASRFNLPARRRWLSLLLPPGQSGNGWRRYFADRGASLEAVSITESMLATSLLKYELRTADGRAVNCLHEWRLPPAYLDLGVPQTQRPDRD